MKARDEILKHIDNPQALFVANHSGGKDSQALLIWMAENVPHSQIVVVHASLGELEWDGAKEHAEKQAADLGLPFIVAVAKRSLFQMVEDRFENRPEVPSWPSSAHRQCTSDLKRGPITREVRKFADDNGFNVVVNCLGIRGEESSARAKRTTWTESKRNTNSKRTWFEANPIHDWTVDQVFGAIADAGQEAHPAYALGNDRLSCVFCIMGSDNDICNGAKARPDLFAKYVELEKRTGYTMHQSRRSLTEIVEAAKAENAA